MGYGHLRPAHALAGHLGGPVLECDQPPLATPDERSLWGHVRTFYEALSRSSTRLGPLHGILDAITAIPPLHPPRDLSAPTAGTRLMRFLIDRGLGRSLARWLDEGGHPLLTTFFAPALAAEVHDAKVPLYLVVTDADVNRVWAPLSPGRTRIRFLVPSPRTVRRLRAYGVPLAQIRMTGFPLPDELVGGRAQTALRANLAARLVRLDPRRSFLGGRREEVERWLGPLPKDDRPPLLTFAVGGAGAQAELAGGFLPGLVEPIRAGRLRVALVAGIRPEVAARFRSAVGRAGLEGQVQILLEPNVPAYFRAFTRLLADTDVLWSKPSELSFYAALGLPVIFSPPVGVHEAMNRRLTLEAGAGLAALDPRTAGGWLADWIDDGTLAGAAWSGATRLPSLGLYEIADILSAWV
jgi:hypothetical protein